MVTINIILVIMSIKWFPVGLARWSRPTLRLGHFPFCVDLLRVEAFQHSGASSRQAVGPHLKRRSVDLGVNPHARQCDDDGTDREPDTEKQANTLAATRKLAKEKADDRSQTDRRRHQHEEDHESHAGGPDSIDRQPVRPAVRPTRGESEPRSRRTPRARLKSGAARECLVGFDRKGSHGLAFLPAYVNSLFIHPFQSPPSSRVRPPANYGRSVTSPV